MSTTATKQRAQARKPGPAASTRRLPARGPIVRAFAKSKKPMTIRQIAEAVDVPRVQVEASRSRQPIASTANPLRPGNVVKLPKVVLPELHDAGTGRIDAQKVADFMGVPLKPLAVGLGLHYSGVHRNPSAPGFQQALRPLKRALELLHEFFGPVETIRIWLNTPHPDLEAHTSLETIMAGRSDAVVLILENAWNGVPV